MMADRTWNPIDARLWDEFKLSKCTRAILAMLISICPNQYGVYDPNPRERIIDWWKGVFTVDQIEAAFDELQQAKIIEVFRDSQCIWLVKKFKRELASIKTNNHIKGLFNFISKYPEIKESYLDMYLIQIESKFNHDLIQSLLSEADSDSDADADAEITQQQLPAPPSPKAKSKPKKAVEPKYSTQDLGLAKWFLNKVAKICETFGYKISTPRTANTIAAGIAKSKLTHEQIRSLLGWMEKNEYQRKSFANLAQWTRATGWTTAWNKYLQAQEIAANNKTAKLSNEDYYRGDKPKVEKRDMTDAEFKEFSKKAGVPSMDEHYEKLADEARVKAQGGK